MEAEDEAAVVLLATATAYLLSRTTGLPGLITDPEEVDLLGVAETMLVVPVTTFMTMMLVLWASAPVMR